VSRAVHLRGDTLLPDQAGSVSHLPRPRRVLGTLIYEMSIWDSPLLDSHALWLGARLVPRIQRFSGRRARCSGVRHLRAQGVAPQRRSSTLRLGGRLASQGVSFAPHSHEVSGL